MSRIVYLNVNIGLHLMQIEERTQPLRGNYGTNFYWITSADINAVRTKMEQKNAPSTGSEVQLSVVDYLMDNYQID